MRSDVPLDMPSLMPWHCHDVHALAFVYALVYAHSMNDTELPTNRNDAALAQSIHYQGEPCKRGHSGLRYTVSGNCVECTKIASANGHERIRKLLRGEQV